MGLWISGFALEISKRVRFSVYSHYIYTCQIDVSMIIIETNLWHISEELSRVGWDGQYHSSS